jgi:hypothetical protein
MERARKKALTRAWLERERSQGVFAVRCGASGQAWVSSTTDLGSKKGGLWFILRMGDHPNPEVQAAWREHAEAAFSFEILEALSEEASTSAGFKDRLKTRERHWRGALGAPALVG